MSMLAEKSKTEKAVIYPDSDGQPMAENTLQYEWIEKIKGNCEALFAENPDVFVAGDLFWYPVKGNNRTRTAPDTMVAFGRPKGYRGSYMQWEEDDIPPQVVFEILSPGNRAGEMINKFLFYDRHGVEEYYVYDPDHRDFAIALRQNGKLEIAPFSGEFVSPRLGVRFVLTEDADELEVYHPDGRRFLSFVELEAERARAEAQLSNAEERLSSAEARASDAEAKTREAEAARIAAESRADQLTARLRELGVDITE